MRDRPIMPWKKLIDEIESIAGPPGPDGIVIDQPCLEGIRGLLKKLGLSHLRARDIADGYLSLLPRKQRRGKGVYYTPRQVVGFILDEVIVSPRIGRKKKVDPFPDDFVILEPACGAGYFLLSAFSILKDAYAKAGFSSQAAVRTILSERLAGIDIDPSALLVALTGLIQEAGDDLDKAISREPITINLFRADFLDKRNDSTDSRYGGLMRKGFPAIVGNPPYVSFYAKRANSIDAATRAYYKANYLMGQGRINTYCLFIERSFDLLKPSGVLGFIVPNTVLIMQSYEPLRRHLLDNGWLKSVVDLSLKVFPEVEVPTCVLTVERRDERALPFPRKVKAGFWESARRQVPDKLEETDQSDFYGYPYSMFNIHIRSADKDIINAIEKVGKPLGERFEVRDGINPANMTKKLVVKSLDQMDPPFRRVLRGKDINSYQLNWDNLWVRYDRDFPDTAGGDYCFLREERIFTEKPKILTRQTANRIVAAWDEDGYYALNTLHVTLPLTNGQEFKWLLALYNSKLLNYYYRLVFPDTEKVFPQVKTINVEKLPLPELNGEGPRLVKLADKLIRTPGSNVASIRNMEKILDEIDEVVYSLYGLSPGHVARIERATG